MPPAREQELLAEIARQRADIERLTLENQLLREKFNLMLARLFDKSSESIDSSQLDLFDSDAAKKAAAAGPADQGPAAETPAPDSTPAKERAARKPRDLSHLPVEETVLTSDEVAENPEAYRLIERIVTDRLDYQPGRILIQRTVREVAEEVLTLSRFGLRNRRCLDRLLEDETIYLAPLEDAVARGKTCADELLERYQGRWQGSIEPLFSEFAF